MTQAVGLFTYWSDGSQLHFVHPDPPTVEEARPFHVVVRGVLLIPISILVFARSEEHAQSRVLQALQECAAKDYHRLPYYTTPGKRALDLLEDLDRGELTWEVHPLDVTQIVAKVNWAVNGGVL